jgi:putative membrane protein insertion efficiency factor
MSRRLDGGSTGAEVPALPAPERMIRELAVAPIRLYQLTISRLLPANTCKYHPSCSEYAVLAIRKHGVLRGAPLAAWRLLRCHPWSMGGVDYP